MYMYKRTVDQWTNTHDVKILKEWKYDRRKKELIPFLEISFHPLPTRQWICVAERFLHQKTSICPPELPPPPPAAGGFLQLKVLPQQTQQIMASQPIPPLT